jgi:hypothetical protein
MPRERCHVEKKQKNGKWETTGPIHGSRADAAAWALEQKLGEAGKDWQIVNEPPEG